MGYQKIRENRMAKDYGLLSEVMQNESLICIVNSEYRPLLGESIGRDICQTSFIPSAKGGPCWMAIAHGITYIQAYSHEEFIDQCQQYDLAFIPPSVSPPITPTPPDSAYVRWQY